MWIFIFEEFDINEIERIKYYFMSVGGGKL